MVPTSPPSLAFTSSLPLRLTIRHSRCTPTFSHPPRSCQQQQQVAPTSERATKMVYSPEDAIRPSLKSMPPYVPIQPYDILAQKLGRHPSDIVKLDANENPYGPSPAVYEALSNAKYFHIYPDPECNFLRDELELYCGVSKHHILVGAGADELIDLLFRLFITPGTGESIINCPPTFGMYKFDADVNGCEIINIPRGDKFQMDIAAIERVFEEKEQNPPKMIFVASPNNPDGSVISDEDVRRLLALPALLVLDEAYFEFSTENRLKWVPHFPNLVVLRTLSKWAGLAGMRVGYGAFPLPVIKHLMKIKQPYNVSEAGQIAALASVKDSARLLDNVRQMKEQRVEFYRQIARFDWIRPYDSQSNFVLCRISGGRTAKEIKEALMKEGILIRYYTTPGISDCIRVSMGTSEQMSRLYKALEQL